MTQFYHYFMAKELENISDSLLSVFSSSNINIYPFQIVASQFAMKSSYQKGVVLCDESGLGKSHEAMLVIGQYFYEGKTRILISIPNKDLLQQWVLLIEKYYSIPCITINSYEELSINDTSFNHQGIILTTYDFAVENAEIINKISWDLMVFEEATALSSVYQEDNKKGKALKELSKGTFKLLLTGTPIEKNIMDLYGLIYFIDETILLPPQDFLKRYLRKPENYPELAEQISKYCFRTLRCTAEQYSKITKRVHITYEYNISKKEAELYSLVAEYCNSDNKKAFPEMNNYDLSLRLLGLLGSSTVAILHTIQGIIKRLEIMDNVGNELELFHNMENIARNISIDKKTEYLLIALNKLFTVLKKADANKKAVIFTESVQTQKYLYEILKDKYNVSMYNGSTDYTAIEEFKIKNEILISTDNGARGFNLEDCSLLIQYDLLYNTLKMEQRIDRCHRLGQENDVIVLSFINKNNFADVRKLELVSKRMLVSDGVLGISDAVIGGFTNNLESALNSLILKTREEIEVDYQNRLLNFEEENRDIISSAEDVLFTTFSKEVYKNMNISPNYILAKIDEINNNLWGIAKNFFNMYNEENNDTYFVINEEEKTITATNYTKLPVLFYYYNGTQNRQYISKKKYGINKDFKPMQGRITLHSNIGKGIIEETICFTNGNIMSKVYSNQCKIAFYIVELEKGNKILKKELLLIGLSEKGDKFTHNDCLEILSNISKDDNAICSEFGKEVGKWTKNKVEYDKLDDYVDVQAIISENKKYIDNLSNDEIERIKLDTLSKKAITMHEINDLKIEIESIEKEIKEVDSDRMKLLTLKKDVNKKKLELKKKEEKHFFADIEIELAMEQKIEELINNYQLKTNILRQFVVTINQN